MYHTSAIKCLKNTFKAFKRLFFYYTKCVRTPYTFLLKMSIFFSFPDCFCNLRFPYKDLYHSITMWYLYLSIYISHKPIRDRTEPVSIGCPARTNAFGIALSFSDYSRVMGISKFWSLPSERSLFHRHYCQFGVKINDWEKSLCRTILQNSWTKRQEKAHSLYVIR